MITLTYKPQAHARYTAVEEVTMVIQEEASKDEAMRAFQQFLCGIGYIFTIEELNEYT